MPHRALWTSRGIGDAVKARVGHQFSASGVSIDSRTLAPGDLFVAATGPNFDGHDFVADAAAKGAAGAIVARAPGRVPADLPLVLVADTRAALIDLARAARQRARARVVAVTGSVGKTGIKEAIGHALRAQAATHMSAGNLNNEWGVPLSLSRLPADAAYAVFELGMNHAREIAPLSHLVQPDVAVVTTIAAVHLANFASVFDIAEAKAEIFEGMHGGTAVLHRDSPYYPLLASTACGAGTKQVVGFGAHPDAQARLIKCRRAPEGSSVLAAICGQRLSYRVSIPGRHWAINSLAVLAAISATGGDVRRAARALASLEAPDGRGRNHSVALSGGAFTLIDESYNASPAAMRAAIETLAASEPGSGGRRIAVLGDMLELGPKAETMHTGLAETLRCGGIDQVYTAGTEMAHLRSALPSAMRAGHAATALRLAPIVAANIRAADIVLVKGSHGIRMDVIVDVLLRAGVRPRAAANDG